LSGIQSGLERVRDRLLPEVPEHENQAKSLARWLYGGLPVVIAGGNLQPVRQRWKGQINENSKSWATFEPLPEMNHNAVVGFRLPAEIASSARVLTLDSSRLHDRIRLRIRVTGQLLDQA